MELRHRVALLELQLDLDRIQAMTERRLRDIWVAAPPERARLCRLPACRRHGACRSDKIRRACALVPGCQPAPPEADRPQADRPETSALPEPRSPTPAPDRPAPPALPRDTGQPDETGDAAEPGYMPPDFRPPKHRPSEDRESDGPPPGFGAPFEDEDFVPPARTAPPLPRLRVLY